MFGSLFAHKPGAHVRSLTPLDRLWSAPLEERDGEVPRLNPAGLLRGHRWWVHGFVVLFCFVSLFVCLLACLFVFVWFGICLFLFGLVLVIIRFFPFGESLGFVTVRSCGRVFFLSFFFGSVYKPQFTKVEVLLKA